MERNPISPRLSVKIEVPELVQIVGLDFLMTPNIEENVNRFSNTELKLSYLAFADYLMIFTRVDGRSLEAVRTTLELFANIPGLQVNRGKSIQIFAEVSEQEKEMLKPIMGFNEGKLPLKY